MKKKHKGELSVHGSINTRAASAGGMSMREQLINYPTTMMKPKKSNKKKH